MKKFMMGLILGAGLMFAVSAHAEVKSFVGEIIEGQFPVKVRGETIESPGIVVNGTSYLPTRTIAELAGFEVAFDADMGIELTKKEEQQAPKPSEAPVTTEQNFSIEEPVVDPKEELKTQLRIVEQEIKSMNLGIHAAQLSLNLSKDNGITAQAQAEIDSYKARIAELEAEKAQIEAQLQQ